MDKDQIIKLLAVVAVASTAKALFGKPSTVYNTVVKDVGEVAKTAVKKAAAPR